MLELPARRLILQATRPLTKKGFLFSTGPYCSKRFWPGADKAILALRDLGFGCPAEIFGFS